MTLYSAVGCIVLLTLSLLVAPFATTAQPQGKMPLIGVLELGSQQAPLGCLGAFRQDLRDLGYVEGQNITVAYRYAEGQRDRLSTLAAELVRLTPDVLWTHSTPAALAAKQATITIPIVLGVANDLVEQDLVESLERPGGNLTGMELRDVELMGKRLELFKEAVPTISRMAVLVDPLERSHAHVPSNIEAEAQALSVQLQRVEAGDPEAFEAAFAAMVQGGPTRSSLWIPPSLSSTGRGFWRLRPGIGCRLCLEPGALLRQAVCWPMGRVLSISANAPPSLWTRSSKAPHQPTCPWNGPTSSTWWST
jgi:putative ABC transport system substrate-binding protein